MGIRTSVVETLKKTFCVFSFLPAVSGEGEFSDRVLDAGGLQLLLRLAHPGDLGVGVDHYRKAIIIKTSCYAIRGHGRIQGGGGRRKPPPPRLSKRKPKTKKLGG